MPRSKSVSHSPLSAAARWKTTSAPDSVSGPLVSGSSSWPRSPWIAVTRSSAARSGGTGAWSMSVTRDSGRAPPPATSSMPAASSSLVSREPRNPAPPVTTTFTTALPCITGLNHGDSHLMTWDAARRGAGRQGAGGEGGASARPGDGFLDRGLYLGRTLHLRHVPGAVDQVTDRTGHRLGLRRRDDPVGATPDHGDRDRVAARVEHCAERGGR